MTADNVVSIDYDPGEYAWDRINNRPDIATMQDRRAAAIWAATQTANCPGWLTFARAHRIYETVPSSLLAMQGMDAAWAELVEACRMGFGPRMAEAVDALVTGVRP